MTAFSDAIYEFMHLVPACPEPEAIRALRFAVIEFCTRTHTQTRWVDKTSAALTFDTTGASAQQVVGLFDAYVDGVQATVIDMNAITEADEATDDAPVVTHNEDLNTSIAVSPAPLVAVPVRLQVSFAPTPDATAFADFLWMRHREGLKAGALRRLLAEPGSAYANADAAAFYGTQFDAAVDSASTAASVNRSTKARRIRVQPAS